MSDPRAELQGAMVAALRADETLQAMFGAGNPVRVYDIPPVNAVTGDYFVIGEDDLASDQAEGLDGAEVHVTVHVWSLTRPPGLQRARQLAAAAQTPLLALAALPSHRIDYVQVAQPTHTLTDVDGRTAHGVLTLQVNTVPL